MLQWARAKGCPWDESTCLGAAMNGHLAVLQWARAQGCPWDERTCAFAMHHPMLWPLVHEEFAGTTLEKINKLLI